jgi:hypothetical protein
VVLEFSSGGQKLDRFRQSPYTSSFFLLAQVFPITPFRLPVPPTMAQTMLPQRKALAAKASWSKASKNSKSSKPPAPRATTCNTNDDASNGTVDNFADVKKMSMFPGSTDDEGNDGSDEQEEQPYRPVAVLSLGKRAASLLNIPSRSSGLFNSDTPKRRNSSIAERSDSG